MPSDVTDFASRLASLKSELVEQGWRVQRAIELAIEAIFERDTEKAQVVIDEDEVIDRVDVRIEKDAVELLTEIANVSVPLSQHDIRMILTVVKVNNEFERIADLAADIAEHARVFSALTIRIPSQFRVMANSVIGIMAQTNRAFDGMDTKRSQQVLMTDDATEAFKRTIIRDVEEQLAVGKLTVDFAFALITVAHAIARMADHCTNVAEQTIYVTTGKIVRHLGDTWTEPAEPTV